VTVFSALRTIKRSLKALFVTPAATIRALRGAPVSTSWKSEAVRTQVRLTRSHADVPCRVRIGNFFISSLSSDSLAFLHREIFVDLAYYFSTSRAAPVVIDGGSNIGVSVAFFKTLYPGARVLAFEPAVRAFELLQKNVGDVSGVELHHAALGRSNSLVPFYEHDDDSMLRHSTRAERLMVDSEITVEQRRLSDFVTGPVDMVKLDVEGAEADVLDDLVESGAIDQVQQLIVEYHHQLDPDRDSLGVFLERLQASGFLFQLSAREQVAYRNSFKPRFQDVLVQAYRPAPRAE
jgi:FkbM family methyltransferase